MSAASGASVARRYRGLKVALLETQGAVHAAETPATVTASWPLPFDLISFYDDSQLSMPPPPPVSRRK